MSRMSKGRLGWGVVLVCAACGVIPDAAAVKVERDTGAAATTAQPRPAQPAAAAPAPELPKLTAAQIAERNVQARGGLAAWRAVQSIQISGLLDAGGSNNARLPYTLQMKRPHYQRVAIEFQGQTAVQVYDGQNGWKLRPFLNRNDVEAFSDDEKQRVAHQDDLDGPADRLCGQGQHAGAGRHRDGRGQGELSAEADDQGRYRPAHLGRRGHVPGVENGG